MPQPLKTVRRRYAEDVCALAETNWPPLVRAFAAVPRERFVGPGPWTVIGAGLQREVTPDADPRHLYRNVLISLDEAKQLNNGQPSFWAALLDRLRPQPGERVAHVGAGGGYYTAILAELVGRTGWVTGIEYEPELAAAAAKALSDRPNVELLAGDAHALLEGPADIIVASCGFDGIPLAWVRALNDGGRLMLPLTTASPLPGIGAGAVLLVARRGEAFDAAFVSGTMIYHDKAGRSDARGQRLAAAFRFEGAAWTPPKLAALRLTGQPDQTCWLAGEGWWLSTAPSP
ncbi:MAG: protein-L-isoaspartate O-methyltransferase family protein [Phenylobacterium sp.]